MTTENTKIKCYYCNKNTLEYETFYSKNICDTCLHESYDDDLHILINDNNYLHPEQDKNCCFNIIRYIFCIKIY